MAEESDTVTAAATKRKRRLSWRNLGILSYGTWDGRRKGEEGMRD